MNAWFPILTIGLSMACAQEDDIKGSGGGFSIPAGSGADADSDSGSDADLDSDADGIDCSEYRMAYPSGPYGTSEGDIMADLPGMVDAAGSIMSLVDVFSDRTKQVLVLANAFET